MNKRVGRRKSVRSNEGRDISKSKFSLALDPCASVKGRKFFDSEICALKLRLLAYPSCIVARTMIQTRFLSVSLSLAHFIHILRFVKLTRLKFHRRWDTIWFWLSSFNAPQNLKRTSYAGFEFSTGREFMCIFRSCRVIVASDFVFPFTQRAAFFYRLIFSAAWIPAHGRRQQQ